MIRDKDGFIFTKEEQDHIDLGPGQLDLKKVRDAMQRLWDSEVTPIVDMTPGQIHAVFNGSKNEEIMKLHDQIRDLEMLATDRSGAWEVANPFARQQGQIENEFAALWRAFAASTCMIQALLEERDGNQKTEVSAVAESANTQARTAAQ